MKIRTLLRYLAEPSGDLVFRLDPEAARAMGLALAEYANRQGQIPAVMAVQGIDPVALQRAMRHIATVMNLYGENQ